MSKENINKNEGQNIEQESQSQETNSSDNKKKKGSAKSDESEKEQQLKQLEERLADVSDKYVRLAAEFDNYRRRTAKERWELISSASEDVIKGFLPILDDCERALQVLKESDSSAAAIEGTELIYSKIMTYLKGRGVSVIESLGKDLDTDYHEAVAQFPVQEEDKKNKIIDVVQQGYMLNEKVIRYAKVVVGV